MSRRDLKLVKDSSVEAKRNADSEIDYEARMLFRILIQILLCFIGAYLVASGFSLFGGADQALDGLLSKAAQRTIGGIAFFIGTFLWWFEDYL